MLEKWEIEEQKCDSSWLLILLGEVVLWFLPDKHSARLCYCIKHCISVRVTPRGFSLWSWSSPAIRKNWDMVACTQFCHVACTCSHSCCPWHVFSGIALGSSGEKEQWYFVETNSRVRPDCSLFFSPALAALLYLTAQFRAFPSLLLVTQRYF